MPTPLVIFDLDGTLIDSKQDLCNSVNATREVMGMPRLADELVASYVGNGAPVLIRRAMGDKASEDEVRTALGHFLSYYREHMLDNTRPYPGVMECLEDLAAGGTKLAVLTNKPERFSKDLVQGLGMGAYFFQVYGGNSFEEKKPHPIGIETLIREAQTAAEQTWMVGDSSTDVLTARNANVKAVGVTYGIQPCSLEQTPPDFLLDSLTELPPLVLR